MIFERIREQLSEMTGSTQEHQRLLELLKQIEDKQVNLLVTGPTGSGKSSTINSLFNMRVAEVGVGVDPQTKDIDCYKLENLVIWDTPGFGDSESADREYARQIINKLEETDVIAKKKRGVQYCEVAPHWGKANGYKEWKYLFIPSQKIMPNSSFLQLAKQFHEL